MNATNRIASLIVRIVAAVAALGVAFFTIGFIFGYIFWSAEMRSSRVMQAVDAGIFLLCASFILDPVLIVRLAWHSSHRAVSRREVDSRRPGESGPGKNRT
jgi:hypothetical protein